MPKRAERLFIPGERDEDCEQIGPFYGSQGQQRAAPAALGMPGLPADCGEGGEAWRPGPASGECPAELTRSLASWARGLQGLVGSETVDLGLLSGNTFLLCLLLVPAPLSCCWAFLFVFPVTPAGGHRPRGRPAFGLWTTRGSGWL